MLHVGAIRRDKGAGSKPRWRAAEARGRGMPRGGAIRGDRGAGSNPRGRAAGGGWGARWPPRAGRGKPESPRIRGPAGEKAAAKLRDAAIEAAHAGVDPSLMPLA